MRLFVARSEMMLVTQSGVRAELVEASQRDGFINLLPPLASRPGGFDKLSPNGSWATKTRRQDKLPSFIN
jgi:hypothetical protein